MAENEPHPSDKFISLAPLDFEQAMKGLLQAGPHPKDDEPAPSDGNEKAPPKRRRARKIGQSVVNVRNKGGGQRAPSPAACSGAYERSKSMIQVSVDEAGDGTNA